MPKHTVTFSLPEGSKDLERFIAGEKLVHLLWNLEQELRGIEEHSEDRVKAEKAADFRCLLKKRLEEEGLDIYRLME